MNISCEAALRVANHLRGISEIENTRQFLDDAIGVCDCCRINGEFELASAVFSKIQQMTLSVDIEYAPKLEALHRKIESRDSRGEDSPQIPFVQNIPPVWIRGWNFTSAMTKWAGGGFRRRTPQEIETILAICHSCEFLTNDTCVKCGCPCIGEGVVDKLVVATEKCPIGKWS